jgi:hypothetical protein
MQAREPSPALPAMLVTSMRQSRKRASVTRKKFMEKKSLAQRWIDPSAVTSQRQSESSPETSPNPRFKEIASLLPQYRARDTLRPSRPSPPPKSALRQPSAARPYSPPSSPEPGWSRLTSLDSQTHSRRPSANRGLRMSKRMSKRILKITTEVEDIPLSPLTKGGGDTATLFGVTVSAAAVMLRDCDKSLYQQQKRICIVAIFSLVVALAINESCAAGDYATIAPPLEELLELERPDRPDRKCESAFALPLKLGCSALAVYLAYLAINRFRTEIRGLTFFTSPCSCFVCYICQGTDF